MKKKERAYLGLPEVILGEGPLSNDTARRSLACCARGERSYDCKHLSKNGQQKRFY